MWILYVRKPAKNYKLLIHQFCDNYLDDVNSTFIIRIDWNFWDRCRIAFQIDPIFNWSLEKLLVEYSDKNCHRDHGRFQGKFYPNGRKMVGWSPDPLAYYNVLMWVKYRQPNYVTTKPVLASMMFLFSLSVR